MLICSALCLCVCFSHDELLARNDVYAGMWKQQLRKAVETETETSSGDENVDEVSDSRGH